MEDMKVTLPKIVFDGIWAIIDTMKMCVGFQKKTRIVVDYDPCEEKWSIVFSQPIPESDTLEEAKQDR